jgi:hypothetical protein
MNPTAKYRDIAALKPCKDGLKRLRKSAGIGKNRWQPVTMLDALNALGASDLTWCIQAWSYANYAPILGLVLETSRHHVSQAHLPELDEAIENLKNPPGRAGQIVLGKSAAIANRCYLAAKLEQRSENEAGQYIMQAACDAVFPGWAEFLDSFFWMIIRAENISDGSAPKKWREIDKVIRCYIKSNKKVDNNCDGV